MLHRQKVSNGAFTNTRTPPPMCRHARLQAAALKQQNQAHQAQRLPEQESHNDAHIDRRQLLQLSLAIASCVAAPAAVAVPDDFTTLPSGLKYLDIRPGEGAAPAAGDRVVVHWSGFTKGYQGKRIDNTSVRDEPYEFVLGSGQVSGKGRSSWYIV